MSSNSQPQESNNNSSATNSNRIQVSSSKNPRFYANLSKKFLSSNEKVELSGLGSAISTAVAAAEILKQQQFATISSIQTSSVKMPAKQNNPRTSAKAKIMIEVTRTENFGELYENEQKLLEQRRREREASKNTAAEEETTQE